MSSIASNIPVVHQIHVRSFFLCLRDDLDFDEEDEDGEEDVCILPFGCPFMVPSEPFGLPLR